MFLHRCIKDWPARLTIGCFSSPVWWTLRLYFALECALLALLLGRLAYSSVLHILLLAECFLMVVFWSSSLVWTNTCIRGKWALAQHKYRGQKTGLEQSSCHVDGVSVRHGCKHLNPEVICVFILLELEAWFLPREKKFIMVLLFMFYIIICVIIETLNDSCPLIEIACDQ